MVSVLPVPIFPIPSHTDGRRTRRAVSWKASRAHEQDKHIMNFEIIFTPYKARKLTEADVPDILGLYLENNVKNISTEKPPA